jgi:hypothetical protein
MRTALYAAVGFALWITAGCVADPQDEPETSTLESALTILPMAGTWTYTETTTVATTCNAPSSVQHIESGPFEVGQVTTASFVVTPHDGTAPFTCKATTTGGFSCPTRAQFNIDLHSRGIDALIHVQATASGVFLDPSRARGKQDAVLTCTGTQCSVMGPNPCGFTVNFVTGH